MKRILHTHPNAAEINNDIQFTKTDNGMLSDLVEDSVAAYFKGIKGFEIIDVEPPSTKEPESPPVPLKPIDPPVQEIELPPEPVEQSPDQESDPVADAAEERPAPPAPTAKPKK